MEHRIGCKLWNRANTTIHKQIDNLGIAPHFSGNTEEAWILKNALADKILSAFFVGDPVPNRILNIPDNAIIHY